MGIVTSELNAMYLFGLALLKIDRSAQERGLTSFGLIYIASKYTSPFVMLNKQDFW